MKKLFNSAIIAFSMYSKIPMPMVDWNKENMKYVMCFFPLVGLANAVTLFLWLWICKALSIGTILMGAVATIIPLVITGGIHLDGFCDTIDGLSSHQSCENKLRILQDPNSGAFAIIKCVSYILINFALWSEMPIENKAIISVGLCYVLSRAFSGLSIVTFKMAKTSGLAAAFSDSAQKKNVKITMYIYIAVILLLILLVDIKNFFAVIIAFTSVFIYYKKMSEKEFGGITGDLAGYFLQIAELSALFAIMLVNKINI